jgi:hypothetical protein
MLREAGGGGAMICPRCDGSGYVPGDEEGTIDDHDWPEGPDCPGCGNPESHCICDDADSYCRSCGRASNGIDNGPCGMCFEMQGGVILPGQ